MNKLLKTIALLALYFCYTSLSAQHYEGKQKEIDVILNNVKLFSEYVMAADHEKIAASYTVDAKIFPNNRDILKGEKTIENYWTSSNGTKTIHHKITPEEIIIQGKTAYDYGYYEGKTLYTDGSEASWKGKYVIVWKKVKKEWKIYLDIWNSIK